MFDNYSMLIIVGLLVVILGSLLTIVKKSFSKNTLMYLYEKNDPQSYISNLNSFKAKFLVSNKQRLMLLIDGYIATKEYDKVYDIFKELRKSKLSFGKKITLYQKEITIYIQRRKFKEAISSYNDLEQEASLLQNNTEINRLLKDAEIMVNVYASKNLEYVDTLNSIITNSNDNTNRGLCNYRIAYLYYFKNDTKNCNKHLQSALIDLKGSFLEDIIKKVIKNNDLLESYNF